MLAVVVCMYDINTSDGACWVFWARDFGGLRTWNLLDQEIIPVPADTPRSRSTLYPVADYLLTNYTQNRKIW